MIRVTLKDGWGGNGEGCVREDGAIKIFESPRELPPVGTKSAFRFFSGLVGATDIDEGSTDLRVDGSSTPVEFQAKSNKEYDIRINKFLIYLQDESISHSGFGALAALSNGIDVEILESGTTTKILNKAKTFADMIQQTLAERPFGDASRAFELDSVSGTEDAIALPMDLGAIVPGGLRIGRGTQDKFVVRINDNLTALSVFTIRVVGHRHYPVGSL